MFEPILIPINKCSCVFNVCNLIKVGPINYILCIHAPKTINQIPFGNFSC